MHHAIAVGKELCLRLMDYLLLGREPSRDQFQNELQAAIDHLEKIKGLL